MGVEMFEVELSLILVDFIHDKGLEAKTRKTKQKMGHLK